MPRKNVSDLWIWRCSLHGLLIAPCQCRASGGGNPKLSLSLSGSHWVLFWWQVCSVGPQCPKWVINDFLWNSLHTNTLDAPEAQRISGWWSRRSSLGAEGACRHSCWCHPTIASFSPFDCSAIWRSGISLYPMSCIGLHVPFLYTWLGVQSCSCYVHVVLNTSMGIVQNRFSRCVRFRRRSMRAASACATVRPAPESVMKRRGVPVSPFSSSLNKLANMRFLPPCHWIQWRPQHGFMHSVRRALAWVVLDAHLISEV